MILIIVLLSIILIISIVINLIFWKTLKNTLKIAKNSAATKNLVSGLAYDDQYYPATVISQIKFNSDSEAVITDFSLYENKGIVGFTIYTTANIKDYFSLQENENEMFYEKLFSKPAIFKNAVVFALDKNLWTWKRITGGDG